MSFDEKYDVTICRNCDSFLLGEWKEFGTVENIIEELVRHSIGKRNAMFTDSFSEPKDLTLQVSYEFDMHEEYISVELEAYGLPDAYSKLARREHHSFVINPKYTTCPRCSKMYGGYYEAIFQIRREGRFLTKDETEEFILEVSRISQTEMEKNNMAFVTKVIKRKEGPDFQMGSLKFTKKMARALQKDHGGSISESYRLTGYDRQEGKARHRATVVLRLSRFETGRYVLYEDGLWKISNSIGKITLVNFGSTLNLDFKKIVKELSMGNIRLLDKSELANGMVVSLDENQCQIMLYEGYSTLEVEPEDVPHSISQGDEVLVLRTLERTYVVNP